MCGDPTCEDPYFIKTTCIAGCAEGCYCNPDHVRENGVCIPAEKCPTSKNELMELIRILIQFIFL